MKKEKMMSIFILPFLWLCYFLFEAITGRIKSLQLIIGNIVFLLLLALIGYFIYKLKCKYSSGFSKKIFISYLIILLIIDQGIKLIIKLFFFNKNITIINNLLYFNPIINTDGSWLNARFNTGISFSFLILLNFLSLFIFIEIYRYILVKHNKNFWIDSCFIFIFIGALCSLIDKLFYGGSLDFIGIGNLFIADLKDIYIDLGLFFFIISIYCNGYFSSDDNTTLKDDLKGIKKFVSFIKKDISSLLNLKK